jgi:seryl-tRNA synthetase
MLLQQLKGLKTEMLLDVGDGRTVAASSFNDHQQFFGECFDIRLQNDEPASTGCVAFGLERWILAFMVTHGPDRADWPNLESDSTKG